MVVMRWIVLVLSLAFAAAIPDAAGQTRGSTVSPVEFDSYKTALTTSDPARRAICPAAA